LNIYTGITFGKLEPYYYYEIFFFFLSNSKINSHQICKFDDDRLFSAKYANFFSEQN